MTEKKFLQKFQQFVFSNYKRKTDAAKDFDIRPQYLTTILKGINPPTPKILDSMGLDMEVIKTRTYTRRPK